jgi:transposase
VICGELHGHKERRPALDQLFAVHGWSLQLGDLSGEDAIFEARSPAAVALDQQTETGILASQAVSTQGIGLHQV